MIGLTGGFLLAYQRSSCKCTWNPGMSWWADYPSHAGFPILVRFYGWTENKREAEKDFKELSQRAKEGKPLWGETDLDEHLQGVAYRNSSFSQLKFCKSPTASHPTT